MTICEDRVTTRLMLASSLRRVPARHVGIGEVFRAISDQSPLMDETGPCRRALWHGRVRLSRVSPKGARADVTKPLAARTGLRTKRSSSGGRRRNSFVCGGSP